MDGGGATIFYQTVLRSDVNKRWNMTWRSNLITRRSGDVTNAHSSTPQKYQLGPFLRRNLYIQECVLQLRNGENDAPEAYIEFYGGLQTIQGDISTLPGNTQLLPLLFEVSQITPGPFASLPTHLPVAQSSP